MTLTVNPLLAWGSRSPDRFWTIFAPPKAREGPGRLLIGMSRQTNGVSLDYRDDGHSRLTISTTDAGGTVRLEALSHLAQAIYSHLNSFCVLSITGSNKLALSFSPCPDIVEIKPSDYPVGRPARLAYLDVERVFHVVEASSGEKGPFKELAKGTLNRDAPLRITIYKEKQAVCRITLNDWARQASTQLSPTAGWDLPENAIGFTLHGDGKNSEGYIVITLASTSVGRGFDSVGHAPGTYRNAMVIEPIPDVEPIAPTDKSRR